jgi:hypothetical protein
MELGLDGFGSLVISELLSFVISVISSKLFHLDVENAVALWEVEVLDIDGKGEV